MDLLNDYQYDISIVITCFNESDTVIGSIDNNISALEQTDLSFEIIVIDDTSSDNSVEVIRDWLANNPSKPVKLRANPFNRGLANNFAEGAFIAKGRYYRLYPGENSQPKEDLQDLYNQTGKADLIIPVFDHVKGKTGIRKCLSNLFTGIVNLISGYKIGYYNGLPVFKRYDILRWHPSSYGFGFQADVVTRLLDEGSTYMHFRLDDCVDRKGKKASALSMRNFLSICHTLLEISVRRLRRELYEREAQRPVEIFPDYQ